MMEDAEGDETRLSTDTDGRSNRDDAELSYWRSQESKETGIHLREAEAKASTAEAVVLRLRIEYHKLCNSG